MVIASVIFVVLLILLVNLFAGSMRDAIIFRPTHSYLSNTTRDHIDRWVGDVMTRWFDNKSDTVMLYLHGNNGNISDRGYVEDFAEISQVNLVLMDYRGYGMSRGAPSVQNMREDTDAVMKVIQETYADKNIVVMSESLGSIAASYIAANYNIRGIIILSGISSFGDMASEFGRVVRTILGYLILDMGPVLTNKELLSCAKSPVLIVHSPDDEIVTFKCAKENLAACAGSRLITIGGGHATPIISQQQLKDMIDFAGIKVDVRKYDNWREKMRTIGHILSFYVIDM